MSRLLNYKRQGEEGKDVLIILHGLFGSLDNWQTLANRYADFFDVVIVDQRNHGKSFHDPAFDYEIMSRDLVELMDHLSIQKAHMIGHSMGGKTVLQTLVDAPERCDRVIIADMGVKQYPFHHGSIIDAIDELDLNGLSKRSEAHSFLSERIESEGVVQFLLKNLYWSKENGEKHLDWRFNFPVLVKNMDAILGPVEVEDVDHDIMFIRGGESNYVLDEDIETLEEHFPFMQLETIDGAGHWLHAEDPDEFFEVTCRFLLH